MVVRSDNAYKGGGGVGDLNEVHRMETFDMDATNGLTASGTIYIAVYSVVTLHCAF